MKRRVEVRSRRLPDALCPYCGAVISAVTSADLDTGVAPELAAGNLTMCMYCLNIMCYEGRYYCRVAPDVAEEELCSKPALRSLRDKRLREKADGIASKTGRRETVN